MTEFARGGLLTGPDPTPIFTETMLALARWDGYVMPASTVRAFGYPFGLQAALDAADSASQP